ncbi:MAG TPA: UPF0280 family protein [Beijerinckiaceae bacterium]
MREGAQGQLLADGRRLHLWHGPIDLVIEAFGDGAAVRTAYQAASRRFAGVLEELCGELAALRTPAVPGVSRCRGPIAQRMEEAVQPFAASTFITPMAAVAGAVAEEILATMTGAARLARAYVNNGGDIALHLAPSEALTLGLVDRPDVPSLFGSAVLRAEEATRGVATSGWRGRSHSLGIADAVTVLARTAAQADAAATVIANAVDLPGHPAIRRVPAQMLQPDSDLRDGLVTVGVGALRPDEIAAALDAGLRRAQNLADAGLIEAAALHCGSVTRILEGRCASLAVPLTKPVPQRSLAHA